MIFLIHLLEHFGVSSGAAIAIVIAGQKFLKGATSQIRAHHDRDDRFDGRPRQNDAIHQRTTRVACGRT